MIGATTMKSSVLTSVVGNNDPESGRPVLA
jgi:hypothetical protein